jgi:sterol 3beta-glucosyltransferase
MITAEGLEFVPTHLGNPQDLLRRPEAQASKSRIESLIDAIKFIHLLRQILTEAQEEYWRASSNADLLIASTHMLGIFDCAEQSGVPWVYALLLPLEPMRAHPSALLAPWGVRLNHPLNLLSHHIIQLGMREMLRPAINRSRLQRGLVLHSRLGSYRWQHSVTRPTLFGFSPSVLPHPTDWPVGHHVTGYWFLAEPPDWRPPDDLVRFLDSGPPPVYIGYGSMGGGNSDNRTRICLEAHRLSGQRGVLLSGWGGLNNETPRGKPCGIADRNPQEPRGKPPIP